MNIYAVQQELEEAEYLFNLPADETKPYEHKYTARDKLKQLLTVIAEISNEETKTIGNALVHFFLAINHYETEENSQAEKYFQDTLKIFSVLPPKIMENYLNYLQECYNSLGVLLVNREDVEKGLTVFAKAEQLKTVGDQMYAAMQCSDIFSSAEYSQLLADPKNTYKLRFTSYLQGGLNMIRLERNYTLTLFYMAQAYTKSNLKEKAVKYCADTLKRQYERKEYELKDWCVNCMSLTDYFIANRQFAQAQYLLMAGLHVIPEGKKKKLRASFQMALGKYLLEFMKFAVEKYRLEQSEEPILRKEINRRTIEFKGISVDFIELDVPKNAEEMAALFRKLNTQIKKSLQVYILDGYVTENIQLCRDLSLGYKLLSVVETDSERILALSERRREIIETPVSEINPKAFENFFQHLSLELGDIYNTLFETKWDIVVKKDSGKGLKKSTVEVLNRYLTNSIKWNDKLLESMLAQKMEDPNELVDYYHTIITTKFNVARNHTRIQGTTREEKVRNLKKGLDNYEWIRTFIKDTISKQSGGLSKEMHDTLKSCDEMIELLPSKIDHINAEKN